MLKNIYVIRHCEAEGQPAESSLTEKGLSQANDLANYLSNKKVDQIISSPYIRAIQSIRPLAEKLQLNIEKDPRLAERVLSTQNLVDWLEQLKETFVDFEKKLEGGESSREAQKRILKVVEEVQDNKTAIIVTHGNIMSLLINYFDRSFSFEEWKKLSNPDVFLLKIEGSKASFERLRN
ncbi:histidine phosphatase family protein [Neobacillus sp. LXY-1]|uniref:histidine phosphatase family protein n=1 Tax=Neobacillus sp. LXY-1 TaxID=3379133 RepID=UPI003EE0851C